MISELRRALGTEQLSLHFQPKVRVADGRLAGCEALLRWEHPRYGRVPPSVFIGVAEKGELMSLLTHEVLKQALAQSHAMRAAGLFTSVAVNVSGHNMVDAAFPETVRTLLAQSGLPPEALTLEITETVLMSDPERAAAVIGDLARQGLALDIDDFGTGYSSLAYLRRLPLRSLKIDRAFVRELTANAQDVHIVRSTVGLAHGLGLSVIAEGVEDSSTLELLGTLGCDMAQGFGICRPVPLPELLAWARARGELRASAAPA
jgi:EAL domain-containing protein (putative c-di-GMP-specific phosphodiesterase class I)